MLQTYNNDLICWFVAIQPLLQPRSAAIAAYSAYQDARHTNLEGFQFSLTACQPAMRCNAKQHRFADATLWLEF
jgi:hypothetical protein